jgi:response regulator RpfG family c-di-GMP phosphodiesterase
VLGRLLAATLASVALAVGAQQAGVLDGLEADSVALRFGLRGSEPSAAVAVVAIDDVTFSDLGEQWPFKRSLHAKAIDRLRAAGARQIVYDVQFTEPTTPREDLALYEAIERAGGAVLATTETDGHGGTNVLGGDENLRRIGAVAGAANLHTDRGGNIRRFPHATGGLPSLAVAAAARMTGRPLSPRRFDPEGAWIDFTGPPGTVPTVSFSDVVEGRAAESMLRGRVVVVGTSAATLQDVHATPTASDRLMSGPEIQANAIDTALRGLPLRDAPGWLGVVTMLVLAALPGLAHLGGRGLRVAAVAPIAGLACLAFAQAAFAAGLVVSVAYPLFALVLATVATLATAFATERRARRRTAEYNEQLEERVRERTGELRETQLEVVRRLGQAAESRDEETGAHIERISKLALRLALKLGLDRGEADLIGHAAAMHDVGKIGIPDRVLHKPSTLDPEEWEVMRSHTTIGAALLSGSRTLLLQVAEAIALTHHERWDGSGYPAGLRGEDIPLAARITAVCDVFDALLSHRPYKRAWTLEATVAEIEAQRGRHFDPRVADAFLALVPELEPELTTRRDKPPMGILTLGVEPPTHGEGPPRQALPRVSGR